MTANATNSDILAVDHLSMRFGGIVAVNDLSFTAKRGDITALIGPNGAGKTTLVAQISGEHRPDSGRIMLNGRDITALKPYERARLGLARSFQITQLCADFTVLENMLLALETRTGGALDFFTNPRRNGQNRADAQQWLDKVGLGAAGARRVNTLAHGQLRQLELAVALCRAPQVLVLDEPMAGMGAEESANMTALLRTIKGQCGLLLIEHDMDVVFQLADRISVLVYGRVLFTGTAEEVRAHPEVRAAYLGDDSPPLAAPPPLAAAAAFTPQGGGHAAR